MMKPLLLIAIVLLCLTGSMAPVTWQRSAAIGVLVYFCKLYGEETAWHRSQLSEFDQNYLRLLRNSPLRTYDIWHLLNEHYGKEILLYKIHSTAEKLERAGLVRTSFANTPGREKPNKIVALTEMGKAYVSQLEPISV